jgi:type IV pilus modification protein PilV
MNKLASSIMRRNGAGFSLIEVLIASLILAIGVAAIVYVIGYSLQKSREPYDRSVAMDLAQQKLEDLRNEDYTLLASGQDEDTNHIPYSVDAYAQPGGIYTRTWVVQADAPMVGTKTITVTVAWHSTVNNSIQLFTIIARPFPEGGA